MFELAGVCSRFTPASLAPSRARRYVASRCEQLPADALDVVLLLTTELLSNAMWHGGDDAWVDVRVEADRVTVGVTDTGGGEVRVANDFRWPEGGHGLRMVEALSDGWGVEPMTGTLGKRVWFELTWSAPR